MTPGLDGIYILGGDQVVAMQVVANTPLEAALADAYAAGAVTGGNSAGAAVESADMIAGYTGNNGPEQGFEQGAVDLWLYDGPTDDTRGLVYGLQGVLLDQHVLQRGRIARLIAASKIAGEVGIGCDADTAATIEGGTNLTEIGGLLCRIRSRLAHVHGLSPSSTPRAPCRSMTSRRTSSRPVIATTSPPDEPIAGGPACRPGHLQRGPCPTSPCPSGSGSLLLAGGSPSAAVLDRLGASAGGAGSSIVVLAAGYSKAELATKDAKAYAAELSARGVTATWFVLSAKTNAAATAALGAADGILLTAPDPATVLTSLAASRAWSTPSRRPGSAGRPCWRTTPQPPRSVRP